MKNKEGILAMFKKLKIGTKIMILISMIMIFLVGVITVKNVYTEVKQGKKQIALFEKNMIQREKRRLYSLMELVSDYFNEIEGKKISREKMFAHIRTMRYGENRSGYFWINENKEKSPKMLCHPFRTLEGKIMNAPKFKGIVTGKYKQYDLFAAIYHAAHNTKNVKPADKDGADYMTYLWTKKGGTKYNMPKLSFVKYYKKFNFIVGSGFYIDDIYASMADMRKAIKDRVFYTVLENILLGILVILVSIAFTYFLLKYLLNRPMNNLLEGIKTVERGERYKKIPVLTEDELGYITKVFNRMVKKIEIGRLKLQKHADNLEETVKKRTEELSKSLINIQSLKNKQDGDYFLTSLIQKPLSPNNARSKNIQIEFVINQYKKFKFKKWESDIGGDLCVTDNIELNGSSYVVFLNGDAMGKSLQGAGGALVLGAAFQSILERTKNSSDVKKLHPERWIKNSFIELHSIFESFDGSMLMSAVFGVIEEKTGLMYFINAEHPHNVLYRDNKASFFAKDIVFTKLGSGIVSGNISVRTFQLKHNDVIFIGSDGRDDILLGETEEGERIINEDENVFLHTVEKAEASIDAIIEITQKKGQLTDDFSLIRIHYRNPELDKKLETELSPELKSILRNAVKARKEKNPQKAILILESLNGEKHKYPEISRELMRNYLLSKKYKELITFGKEYTKINPNDTQAIFYISVALNKTGKLDESIDWGERVKLRQPNFVANLVNLSDAYFLKSNFSENETVLLKLTKKYLEKASKIEENNRIIISKMKKIYSKLGIRN